MSVGRFAVYCFADAIFYAKSGGEEEGRAFEKRRTPYGNGRSVVSSTGKQNRYVFVHTTGVFVDETGEKAKKGRSLIKSRRRRRRV